MLLCAACISMCHEKKLFQSTKLPNLHMNAVYNLSRTAAADSIGIYAYATAQSKTLFTS